VDVDLPPRTLQVFIALKSKMFSKLHIIQQKSDIYYCQHPISSGQIKLFQNKKIYKIKIKLCYVVFIILCHLSK